MLCNACVTELLVCSMFSITVQSANSYTSTHTPLQLDNVPKKL